VRLFILQISMLVKHKASIISLVILVELVVAIGFVYTEFESLDYDLNREPSFLSVRRKRGAPGTGILNDSLGFRQLFLPTHSLANQYFANQNFLNVKKIFKTI
jgi:hypothetical protein